MNESLDSMLPCALREAARRDLEAAEELPCPPRMQRSRARLLKDPEKWRSAVLRPVWLGILRAAACVALFCALSLALVWTVNPKASASFTRWLRVVGEQCTHFMGFGKASDHPLPDYRITALPEGARLTDVLESGGLACHVYTVEDGFLYFDYMYLSESTGFMIKTDDLLCEEVWIDDCPGYFYFSEDPAVASELMWVDEAANIAFSLGYDGEKQELLHMAESVVLEEMTK